MDLVGITLCKQVKNDAQTFSSLQSKEYSTRACCNMISNGMSAFK